MLKTKQFAMLFIMNTFSVQYGYFMMSTFKNFGQEQIKDDSFLTATGAIASVMGGLRWIWSYYYDKTSYKQAFGVLLVIQIIISAVTSIANQSKPFYFIVVCLASFCQGGHFTLVPAVTKMIYGKRASEVYGILLIYTGISSIASATLVTFLLKEQGYTFFFGLGCVFTIISLILLFFFEEKKCFR